MINEAKMTELTQAEDMAYFRADLCIYSPESYSLEEKKGICNGMMATSEAVPDVVLRHRHVLLELVGALQDLVALLDLCREGVQLDLHDGPALRVGEDHPNQRHDTGDARHDD
ncbi:hypothetical protein AAY81_03510 [Denitrobacterium detoxificans]|uniref:Uncharacterized protein n=1 Tax=Denitrobacterium detoxificans TaxID=79604 RepID=A0A172RXG8_9ACTN|nr:hypothetical protein [Denitrobacterium detoxificans]ANE22354.1 hypothetical protein AAY81_03510 [Denitrobacterium detoxificans]SEP02231.1 hypothetical protein SAMN02910314_01944 [Denitrobacterium detoxificans]